MKVCAGNGESIALLAAIAGLFMIGKRRGFSGKPVREKSKDSISLTGMNDFGSPVSGLCRRSR